MFCLAGGLNQGSTACKSDALTIGTPVPSIDCTPSIDGGRRLVAPGTPDGSHGSEAMLRIAGSQGCG